MTISRFFIDRPIFSSVISILIILIGMVAYINLPVSQYPEIAPPTIQISATYPGASAKTISDTVATPIEQEVNGVEGMIYMQSQATADGALTITVTFQPGIDIDIAQVLVQNRVARAEPRLPEEVRRLGVVTQKASPDFLMVIHLISPDNVYDQLYISNYATLQIRDQLSRVDGVGNVLIFGARDYAMRVWIDPERAAELDLTASEIVAALRAQNVQVASGTVNQAPLPSQDAFELSVQTQGRLTAPDQFENIVVRGSPTGDSGVIRLRDVGRVELGAQSYSTNAYLDNQPAVAMAVFQRPGSNAIATSNSVLSLMESLSAGFPEGLAYRVIYNPTEFVAESVNEVYRTLIEATLLVVLVIFVFLQSFRASIIPVIAIPISLIGTFFVMSLFGFSLNNLSLFGLVLAIGIVVDDAIVVVENVERQIEAGLSPAEAAYRSMEEVSGALIATSLVLAAVFIPTAFIPGITGAFYRQFALTIAAATAISTLVSLTLSPAMARLLLKPDDHSVGTRAWQRPLEIAFNAFNHGFDRMTNLYGGLVSRLVRISAIVVAVFVGLLVLTGVQFNRVPAGFIPDQDQGYLITAINLPQGASLERTDEIVRRAADIGLNVPGIAHAAEFAGFNGATFTNASNAGAIFFTMEDFDQRDGYRAIQNRLQNALREGIDEAFVLVIAPPPVRGVGNGAGFKMMVQDRAGLGLEALQQAAFQMMLAANEDPMLQNTFTFFEVSTPQVFLDIDREKAELMGVPVSGIFEALEIYLGSAFINDFNYLGRTFRVTAQADARFRDDIADVDLYFTRNQSGGMVPLGAVADARRITGSSRVLRYNLYPAAAVQGEPASGISSGEALDRMEALAADVLPDGISFEWTELAYQQKQTGNTAGVIFLLSILFVFLVLAAQYESLPLPFSVILIMPMTILFGITGTAMAGLSNNILTQIGFVVLIALAAKNAILIVEFAKQQEEQGVTRFEAAVVAARLRLRPILMTSFAFILGVLPLVLASGAGAEMRISLGVVVFSGMIGVTIFGLLLTPVFYVLARWLRRNPDTERGDKIHQPETPAAEPAE
ncbi:MAG: multidrug efflux RND transporter permease subunit [Pseudomonadota bacterium]